MRNRQQPDLMLLDLTLPALSGLEVREPLKKLDPQAPIIIGTSDIQELTRKVAFRLGANGYLVKPFHESHVRKAVQMILASPC